MKDKKKVDNEITVSVIMITYGHAQFIKEAISGVLIQECNFPIELIIADDNSPDNTEEEVMEFLKDHPKKHLVKYTKHKENKGMHENFQWVTDESRGKYIAQCEGDDYWIDPYKLQKQVDFLEQNPEYGLVYTKTKVFEQRNKTFWQETRGREISNKHTVLFQNPITSLTTVYRADLNRLYLKENGEKRSNWMMGDYPKWIWFSYNSKIHFMKDVTAVYRLLENSASNFEEAKTKMAFKKNTIE
ncbi:MAG: glycosyltransferase, partial [Bacteroidota bacterium]